MGLQLALAYAMFVLIGSNDGESGVLLPSLQAHYGVSKGGISLLFMFGTGGYLLAALTSGLVIQALGWRWTLAGAAGLLAGGLGLAALAPPWPLFLTVWLLVGLGGAGLDAGLNGYIATLPKNQARLNDLHAFYGLGALVGPLFAAGLLAAGGVWPQVYAVGALAAALMSGVALWAFGGAAMARPAAPGPAAPAGERGNVLVAALRRRAVWLAALILCIYVGTEVSIGSWAYSLLIETRAAGPLLAGGLVSGYWLGLTIGRVVLGRIGGRFGGVRVVSLALGGTAVGLLLLAPAVGWPIAGGALLLIGFCLGPIFPTMIALITEVIPARLVPSAVGFMAAFGAGGAALFPALTGALADRVGVNVMPLLALALIGLVSALWLAYNRGGAQRAA